MSTPASVSIYFDRSSSLDKHCCFATVKLFFLLPSTFSFFRISLYLSELEDFVENYAALQSWSSLMQVEAPPAAQANEKAYLDPNEPTGRNGLPRFMSLPPAWPLARLMIPFPYWRPTQSVSAAWWRREGCATGRSLCQSYCRPHQSKMMLSPGPPGGQREAKMESFHLQRSLKFTRSRMPFFFAGCCLRAT